LVQELGKHLKAAGLGHCRNLTYARGIAERGIIHKVFLCTRVGLGPKRLKFIFTLTVSGATIQMLWLVHFFTLPKEFP